MNKLLKIINKSIQMWKNKLTKLFNRQKTITKTTRSTIRKDRLSSSGYHMKNIKILDLGLKFTDMTEVGDLHIDFKVTEV